MDNLTSLGGNLYIDNNGALTSLSVLDNLTSVGGDLFINNNGALTSLSVLDNLTSVGGYLDIRYNGALTSLSGLDNLTSVGGLYINNNGALTSLSGLDNLTSVGGDLDIRYNGALTSLSGLDNLTSVGGNLYINNNAALTSLSDLDNLTSVGVFLYIAYNSALTDISGLANIDASTITNLYITNNAALSVCEIQSVCDYLNVPANTATIENNNTGCNSRAEVEAECAAALPVELIDFSARVQNEDVLLFWQTASEINNEGFEIQRSMDGKNFEEIDFIEGNGTTLEQKVYSFNDEDVEAGQLYYYRLKQIDFDGVFEYSKVITAQLEGDGNSGFFSPNPSQNGQTRLNYTAGSEGQLHLRIFDVAGKELINQTHEVNEGVNNFELNFSDLGTGMFLREWSKEPFRALKS